MVFYLHFLYLLDKSDGRATISEPTPAQSDPRFSGYIWQICRKEHEIAGVEAGLRP